MSEVKITMPSSIDNTGTSTNESPMLCAGLSQLEKSIKAYIDNVIVVIADGKIEISRVKDAATVDGHTVAVDVPADAKFTDTIYIHPTTSGYMHIPGGGSSNQILRWSDDGTAIWGDENDTTYSIATTSNDGLMTSTMVANLDTVYNSLYTDFTEDDANTLVTEVFGYGHPDPVSDL